jgi:hypothetical protein
MQTTWIASSRVTPPRQRVVVLPRARLLERLLPPADPPRVSVIQAPAGFGKTTLLAELHSEVRARGATAAWVGLESSECDLHWLYAYLLVALRRSNVALPGCESTLDDELLSWPVVTLARVLIAALESHQSPIVLLIDDAHLIPPELLAGEVASLAEHLPDRVRLILTSRSRIDRPFWRLATHGQLDVIDDKDLRFTADEMRGLSRNGPPVASVTYSMPPSGVAKSISDKRTYAGFATWKSTNSSRAWLKTAGGSHRSPSGSANSPDRASTKRRATSTRTYVDPSGRFVAFYGTATHLTLAIGRTSALS